MQNYIIDKTKELIRCGKETQYSSLSIIEFLTEFDYATKYLSRLLKVRPFVIYILFFKKAYFKEGKRVIAVKLSNLGENLLSDIGQPMSHDVVRRGVNDLVRLRIIEKQTIAKPGQINEYEIKLPSEIREVKEMILKNKEKNEEFIDNSKDDFYTDLPKKIEILKRENYKCFYCLKEIQRADFYLDHLLPKTKGGQNYKTNLVASCKTCNTKKMRQKQKNFYCKYIVKIYLPKKNTKDKKKNLLN